MDKDKLDRIRQLSAFVTIPFALGVPPIFGWAIGNWLDKKFDTAPYLMIAFIILGMFAGARECYRIIMRFGNNK